VSRRYAASAVFPAHWLHDRPARARLVHATLRNTVLSVADFPRDRPFIIGNLRYGAMIVPNDPLANCHRAHPLEGKIVHASQVDDLLDEIALATEAGEINHLGSWAVVAFGDVIFEDGS